MDFKLIRGKKKSAYNFGKAQELFNQIVEKMPDTTQNIKVISPRYGFTVRNMIYTILLEEVIENLYISSFRIGSKEMKFLNLAGLEGKIKKAFFVVGNSMNYKSKGRSKNHPKRFYKMCTDREWEYVIIENHSKICLMQTDKGNHYVIETSSNLNRNPNIEFFNIENDIEAYNFYKQFFHKLLAGEEL